MKERNDFYIGWMAKAPRTFAKHIRKVILALLVIFVVVGALLAYHQKKFSTSNFEFGVLTEVKGIYFNKPVPLIKVFNGTDIFGNASYTTIPLVGYGKSGADGIMSDLEKAKGVSLDQKEISLKGTLLYSDGKTLMQVDKMDNPLVSVSTEAIQPEQLVKSKELGVQTLRGEILDPKCYFGVMKPGEGKVHKDCAIRCILGGIPPVLRVKDAQGRSNYYLIVGKNGEKMNKAVQDFVAEPVTIEASVVQYDDWIVLYVDGNGKIKRI